MTSSKRKKINHFIAVWDMTGLECLFDVSQAIKEYEDWEKAKTVAILKEEKTPPKPRGIPLEMMLLRARVNTQRKYEIYEFTSELSYKEVVNIFEEDPQVIVESIREIGHKIYSDRHTGNTQRIV